MHEYSLKFIRYGLALSLLGLFLGYLPLGHYLMSDSTPSCPSAPVHGHVILLSLFGMSIFGLLYKFLPDWLMQGKEIPLRLVKTHFLLAVVGIVGVLLNGTLGYEYLNHFMQQGFYYLEEEGQYVRNIWFAIDGLFLSLYALGVGVLTYIFTRYTAI
jgi:cbb3-type cytochrome oxidase subunit 1